MFLECVSNGIMLKKSQNFQNFRFFWQKLFFFFEKEHWFVSKTLIVTKVSRMRIKWCYCLWNLKTFKICFFFWKKHGFLEKRFGFFQNRQKWQTFSRIRLKWYQWLRNLKTFKIGVFFEKNGFFFRKRALKCFKTAKCHEKVFQKASQMVLLLKNSQNLQYMGFFLEKNWIFLIQYPGIIQKR